VEDIQKVKIELEQAKEEEIKVLELYTKIEKEVNSLVERISDFEEKRSNVESESEAASEERQGLQSFLNKILDDNAKLNAKLQSMEDEEDEKRMDDVLEGMQAKMRALRLKRNKKGTGQK
jgi:chromosome segregation ATPase